MSRGYRIIIVAAVGWLTLGNQAPSTKGVPSPTPTPKEQTQSSANNSPSDPQSISVTIIESAEQAKAAQRVESESRKHDARDLDAQIRAADAAEKQVFPTWMGALLGFIGTLMILWSLMVAREANKIAQDSIEGQTRPWVKVDAVPTIGFRYVSDDDGECFEYATLMTMKNVGQSPAIDASYLTTLLFIDPTPDQLKTCVEAGDPQKPGTSMLVNPTAGDADSSARAFGLFPGPFWAIFLVSPDCRQTQPMLSRRSWKISLLKL